MRSGTLNRRITLQRPAETTNSFGEAEKTWTDVYTVWAAIEPLAGREYFAAQQMQSSTDVRIRIRYVRGISTKWRAVYVEQGSPLYTRYYDIESVIQPKTARKELHLMCVEREADGFR